MIERQKRDRILNELHHGGIQDAGYIDPADPANLDPANSRYVRPTLLLCRPTTTEFALRPRRGLSRTTSTRYGAGPASERHPGKSDDTCR